MYPFFRFLRLASGLASLAFLAGMQVCAQGPSTGKSYTLSKMSVKGSNRYGPEDIFAAGGLKKGQQIDLVGLEAAASQILKTGALSKIGYSYSFAGDSISVEFQVSDAEKFLPCLYDNFVWFSDSELTSAVHREVPLFDGSAPVGGDMVTQITSALERFLKAHKITGTVTATMSGKLGSEITGYTLEVIGVPMPVVSIGVTGGPLGPGILTPATQMHIGPDFSRTLASGSGRYGLMEAYRNEGYLQVKFTEPKITLKDPQGFDSSAGIIVNFDVTSGPLYNWNGAIWSGNRSLQNADLERSVQLKIGDIVRQNKVKEGWVSVYDSYGRLGYLEAQLKEVPEFDAAQHQVQFKVSITEGPQYHMGEFSVTGVPEPLATKLKTAWKMHSGEVFDKSYGPTFMHKGMSEVMKTATPGRQMAVTLDTKMNTQTHLVDVVLQFR